MPFLGLHDFVTTSYVGAIVRGGKWTSVFLCVVTRVLRGRGKGERVRFICFVAATRGRGDTPLLLRGKHFRTRGDRSNVSYPAQMTISSNAITSNATYTIAITGQRASQQTYTTYTTIVSAVATNAITDFTFFTTTEHLFPTADTDAPKTI